MNDLYVIELDGGLIKSSGYYYTGYKKRVYFTLGAAKGALTRLKKRKPGNYKIWIYRRDQDVSTI